MLGELAQKFDIIPYNEAAQAYVIDYRQVNTGKAKNIANIVSLDGCHHVVLNACIRHALAPSSTPCMVLRHTHL